MHTLLPLGTFATVPNIAPLKFVYAAARPVQRPLVVQRTLLFAPQASDLAGADSAPPGPAQVPASAMGTVGGDRSASLTGSPAAESLTGLQDVAEGNQPSVVATTGDGTTLELNRAPEPEASPPAPNGEAHPHAPDGFEDESVGQPSSEPPALAPAVPRQENLAVHDAVERLPNRPGPTAAASVAGPATRASESRASEKELVQRLIDEYTGAYERLDVGAIKAVRPSVDDKALKRAFEGLSGQRLTLQGCGITISGSTANARCQGNATYQPRIGTRAVQIAREWTFDLSKKDTAWQIVNTLVQ